MLLLTPQNFPDYELIDSGDFEKLERFGKYILIRPEPQAVWSKKLSKKEWIQRAHVEFKSKSSSAGVWNKLKEMPDQWSIKYQVSSNEQQDKKEIKFRLGLTSFKHVGVFPEQAVNWDFIFESVRDLTPPLSKGEGDVTPTNVRVLNLFAYTGGASLAARAAGADVTHLDSVKQVVTWAKENMEISGLKDIRWLVEDAMTFVKRELKRGKKYHGIILDPPAYGHGPNGESWKLEDHITEMMQMVSQLLEEKFFLVLNTYSLGFSSLILQNLMNEVFPVNGEKAECGELYLQSTTGPVLPLGVFARLKNVNEIKTT